MVKKTETKTRRTTTMRTWMKKRVIISVQGSVYLVRSFSKRVSFAVTPWPEMLLVSSMGGLEASLLSIWLCAFFPSLKPFSLFPHPPFLSPHTKTWFLLSTFSMSSERADISVMAECEFSTLPSLIHLYLKITITRQRERHRSGK